MKKMKINSKLSIALFVSGGIAIGGGLIGTGIGVRYYIENKTDSDKKVDNGMTTKIIETTEKPIETEETIITTIKNIIEEGKTIPVETVPAETSKMSVETAPVETPKVSVVTTVVETTKAPVVTTVSQTIPVETTATQKVSEVTAMVNQAQEYAYKDIDLARFEELTQNLVDEYNRVGLVKSKGKKYTKADLYGTVYSYNIDDIDEDVKQQLIDKNYIADDSAVFVDSASPRDAVMTDTITKSNLNTNMDEIYFGLNYFKNDEAIFYQLLDNEGIYNNYDYNSTIKIFNRVTEKLKTLDMDEYFEMRNKYLKKHPINTSLVKFISHSDDVPAEFIGINSYQLEDFVDISVAINDPEARQNVQKTLQYVVDASLDNSKSFNSLVNFSNFCMEDKEHTSLTDCGAGATFAMNTYIYAYSEFLGNNPYKNLQGFAKDEEQYEQMKIRYNRIVNDSQDISDVVRIHESCSKQLTK